MLVSLMLKLIKMGFTTSLVFDGEPTLLIIDPNLGEVGKFRINSGIYSITSDSRCGILVA